MSKRITQEVVLERARIVEAPRTPTKVDRSFELPRALYGATVAAYLGFLGVTALAFSTPGLIIPMVIFTFFIVAGFGLPTIWTRMRPDNDKSAKSWTRFASEGIMTHTGRLAAKDATIQVLILPVLVLLWGFAVVTIAATV